jgi:hypothetical protein
MCADECRWLTETTEEHRKMHFPQIAQMNTDECECLTDATDMHRRIQKVEWKRIKYRINALAYAKQKESATECHRNLLKQYSC